MRIDPVLPLADEIRQLEKKIHAESELNRVQYDRGRMETISQLLRCLCRRYEELWETEPTSALGASELIRFAASRLPFSQGCYAAHLHRIADRLAAGKRLPADLVWLRALTEALHDNNPEESPRRIVALLALAVKGMAQPVVIYRAALPLRTPIRDLNELSRGPFETSPFVPQQF